MQTIVLIFLIILIVVVISIFFCKDEEHFLFGAFSGGAEEKTSQNQNTEESKENIESKESPSFNLQFSKGARTVFPLKDENKEKKMINFNKVTFKIHTLAREFLFSIDQESLVKKFTRLSAATVQQQSTSVFTVVPDYQFTMKDEIGKKFYKNVTQLYKQTQTYNEVRPDVDLSKQERQQILQVVMQLINVDKFPNLKNYFKRRTSVAQTLLLGNWGGHQIEANQEKLLNQYLFFETVNMNGHCTLLTMGIIMLFQMILNPKVHRRIVNIYKCYYDYFMSKQQDTGDFIYVIFSGMIKMHISSYIDHGEIIEDDLIEKYIKEIYANVCDITQLSRLNRDQIISIVVMLTILYRMQMLFLYFADPLELFAAYIPQDPEFPIYVQKVEQLLKIITIMESSEKQKKYKLTKKNIGDILRNRIEYPYGETEIYDGPIQEHENIIMYLIASLSNLFQYKFNYINKQFVEHLIQLDTENLIEEIYLWVGDFFTQQINYLLESTLGSDIYGGLFDIFEFNGAKYARINWSGQSDHFVIMCPFVLGHCFGITQENENYIPIVNFPSPTFDQIPPGIITLNWSVVIERKDVIPALKKSLEKKPNFVLKKGYTLDNIFKITQQKYFLVNEELTKTKFLIANFPGHVSLLVKKDLFQDD